MKSNALTLCCSRLSSLPSGAFSLVRDHDLPLLLQSDPSPSSSAVLATLWATLNKDKAPPSAMTTSFAMFVKEALKAESLMEDGESAKDVLGMAKELKDQGLFCDEDVRSFGVNAAALNEGQEVEIARGLKEYGVL